MKFSKQPKLSRRTTPDDNSDSKRVKSKTKAKPTPETAESTKNNNRTAKTIDNNGKSNKFIINQLKEEVLTKSHVKLAPIKPAPFVHTDSGISQLDFDDGGVIGTNVTLIFIYCVL